MSLSVTAQDELVGDGQDGLSMTAQDELVGDGQDGLSVTARKVCR